ncbi:MAG TPA: MarR family transcriptional regulator [Lacipirellulaceae bacterium]|nr:MarR family transcriptional regulator [Lacipirellulaceae bacterium]
MLEYDFQSSIGYWLCMTSHAYERAMNEELTAQGITFRQCQVLAWLAIEGEQTQADLAARMSIEPPTLVRVLDRMERDGLVARTDCPDDRRRKIIKPLPKARPLWKRIIASAEVVRNRATAGLSRQELATLKGLLGRMRENLQAPAKAAAPNRRVKETK